MYTDDVVLLAKSEKNAELKEMLKRSKNFGKEKVKPKYTQIKDNGVRERKRKKEEEIEMGRRKDRNKKIKYLEYGLQKNGKVEKHIRESIKEKHIRERIRKAMIAMKRTWSIGKRIFKKNYMKRMKMFDPLIESVALYGVEKYGKMKTD